MDTIGFDEFKKLDIRIATVVNVTIPEGSAKLFRLEVDLGSKLGTRIIFAGLKGHYEASDLIDKQIVVLANLSPKQFFGEDGQGMLLAADENNTPVILQPVKKVSNGSIVR